MDLLLLFNINPLNKYHIKTILTAKMISVYVSACDNYFATITHYESYDYFLIEFV